MKRTSNQTPNQPKPPNHQKPKPIITHPLPPRPIQSHPLITTHHKKINQNKENQHTKSNSTHQRSSLQSMNTHHPSFKSHSFKTTHHHHHHHQSSFELPIKPTLHSKSINQLPSSTEAKQAYQERKKEPFKLVHHQTTQTTQTDEDGEEAKKEALEVHHHQTNQTDEDGEESKENQVNPVLKPIHARTGSIRSLSSSSTLLSPTTREAVHLKRTLTNPLSQTEHSDNESCIQSRPQQERVLAIVKVRQAVLEAKARKVTNGGKPLSVYTPKPLLLPYKLARSHSLNQSNPNRIGIRSNTLDQQIHSLTTPSLLQGERPTHRRQLRSESMILNHRRISTESNLITSSISPPLHPRIHSPRSVQRNQVNRSTSLIGISSDHRRSQYDSFYQLLGPESGSEPDQFREPDSNPRKELTQSVLLSPVLIKPSRSWNPYQIQTHHSKPPISSNHPEIRTSKEENPMKKLRSYKSDGSILLKKPQASLNSINNQPILFQRNPTQTPTPKPTSTLVNRNEGFKGKEVERLSVIGRLKSILEENEEEVEFESPILNQFLKFKKFVWN
ncbi:hypothetical protein DFH28DRAFT_1103947 [Melampsora americana]|nr:hypothetical protein DFH28DRAFT_1103947 [Melampsora americana]